MPKTSNTHNTDLGAWTDAISPHWCVYSQAGAEHGRCILRFYGFRDCEDKLLVGSDGCRVPALRKDTVGVIRVLPQSS